ncbi:MAG TPA: hypothetical protein VFI19_06205, partial [Nocardioides sp.]|nr:hypothetical protein [Nocardioides sp.]
MAVDAAGGTVGPCRALGGPPGRRALWRLTTEEYRRGHSPSGQCCPTFIGQNFGEVILNPRSAGMTVMEPAATQFDRMAADKARRIDCSM